MMALPVTTTTGGPTAGQVTDQLTGHGIGFDEVWRTLSPIVDTFWPVLKFGGMVILPALLIAGIGYFFFMRWSQAGVKGL